MWWIVGSRTRGLSIHYFVHQCLNLSRSVISNPIRDAANSRGVRQTYLETRKKKLLKENRLESLETNIIDSLKPSATLDLYALHTLCDVKTQKPETSTIPTGEEILPGSTYVGAPSGKVTTQNGPRPNNPRGIRGFAGIPFSTLVRSFLGFVPAATRVSDIPAVRQYTHSKKQTWNTSNQPRSPRVLKLHLTVNVGVVAPSPPPSLFGLGSMTPQSWPRGKVFLPTKKTIPPLWTI